MSLAAPSPSAASVPHLSPRALRRSGLALAAMGLALYVVLPRLVGVRELLDDAELGWVLAAAPFELASFVAYATLLGAVVRPSCPRLTGSAAWTVTLAGVAATRLVNAAGAGGLALSGWALTAAGLTRREAVERLTTFNVLLYAVYFGAIAVGGLGLWLGLLAGPAPDGLTLMPALVAVAVGLLVAAFALAGRRTALATGVRAAAWTAVRRPRSLVLAAGWWAGDLVVLALCLHAFGDVPPAACVVVAYFVGTAGNVLPLPGGAGGVEGGMVLTLTGFGMDAGPAVAGVLAYRVLSFWLPTLPGVLAYVRLLRLADAWRASSDSR